MDHVKDYRPPKDTEDMDDITKHLREQGCAPKTTGPPPSHSSSSEEERDGVPAKRIKKGHFLLVALHEPLGDVF